MFRGKESSNRIELSRLVQDLLNFGVLGSLRLWGWGGWVEGGGGWLGGALHTCAHARACTHAHARTCMLKCVLNMIISCKWPPPFGESLGIPYDVICARACMCVHACACICMCVGGTFSSSPPPSTHPPPPRGGPSESVKIQ